MTIHAPPPTNKGPYRPSRELSARLDLHVEDKGSIHPENWDFADADTQYLLHNLHPYPARFIPQIPRRAIERWASAQELVLDPFCGSGTTLLEAKLLGRSSIGVDNNGVATLVARAKLADYSPEDLDPLEALARKIERPETLEAARREAPRLLSTAPDYRNRTKWFDEAAVADLAWLRRELAKLSPNASLLGLAVVSSLVVQVSRQDSDTRYAAIDRPYLPGSALRSWARRTRSAVARARQTVEANRSPRHEVHLADGRRLGFIEDASVGLLVTSPPYLNAYDYHKYHRHRLHWIGADVSLARNAEIGKHDTFTRPGARPDPYFRDMGQCFGEWSRVLKPGARALVVVGDAIVSGEFVPVADRFVSLASDAGFTLERRWVRRIEGTRKSFNQNARIRREHVLLFRKLPE